MECQARNVRQSRAAIRTPAMMALSSSGKLTEGASLVDALRAELATAPRPMTGAPVPSKDVNNNINGKDILDAGSRGVLQKLVADGDDKVHPPRAPVFGANHGTQTPRYTQVSQSWSGSQPSGNIPW